MLTDNLTEQLRPHFNFLKDAEHPEARSIANQFQAIQHLIRKDLIYLMDKRHNFIINKHKHLQQALKALYEAISCYRSKVAPRPSFTLYGAINYFYPDRSSYQSLIKEQETTTVKENLLHCDKIKEIIQRHIPKSSRFTHFYKSNTISDQQAEKLADCLIENQTARGITI